MVRKAGGGFRTFRKQVGNFKRGYPCLLRSEYYNIVRDVLQSRMEKAGIKEPSEEMRKDVLRLASQTLKYLWKLTAKKSEIPA